MSNRLTNLQNQIVQDKFKLTVDGGILTENERQFYEDNGYFVVREMFSKQDIENWNNRFIQYADGKLDKLPGMQIVRDVSLAKKGFNKALGEQAITKIQDWQEDNVLFTFCNHPKMIPYLKSFCGASSAKSVHTMFINKPPNVGSTSRHPIHQDQVYFPFGPADRIVAGWASLEDANQVNGCLTVYPKSHKLGPLEHAYPDWEGGVNKSYFGVKELPKMDRIYLEMKAGDIVFFHPYLLHGSGENRSQGYRKSICCHFASADCKYHDIKGTFHEQLAEEIMTVAKKFFGPDIVYHDIWRKKVKQEFDLILIKNQKNNGIKLQTLHDRYQDQQKLHSIFNSISSPINFNTNIRTPLKKQKIIIDPEINLRQKWVLEVEIILTLLIMIDIIIRILAEGEDFFKQKWNKIDLASFLIILLLVTTFYSLGIHAQNIQLYYFKRSQTSTVVREFDDVIGLSLIILRYLIQIARIVIVIKQSHKVQQMRQVDDIKFEPVEKNEKNSQEKEEILEQQIEIHPQEI